MCTCTYTGTVYVRIYMLLYHVGSACRNKVIKWLSVQFKTPADAEAHYFGGAMASVPEETLPSIERLTLSETSCASVSTQADLHMDHCSTDVITERFKKLSKNEQLEEMSKLFQLYVLGHYSLTVPSDFLELATRAMAQLKHHRRSNVLYNLAKCMGILRQDSGDSWFPMKQMPMGMVEYIANFFVSEDMHHVSK